MRQKLPNRFVGLSYVNVSLLRVSMVAGCLFNLVIFLAVGVLLAGLFFLAQTRLEASEPKITRLESTSSVFIPTVTSQPTFTPFPTSTTAPSSTPFTVAISLALPTATPRPPSSYSDLTAGLVHTTVASTYPLFFCLAFCVPASSRP